MCICMSKSFYEEINLLLFVQYESEHVMDGLAENAKSEEKMQGVVDRMSKACDNFQLGTN